MPAGIQSDSQQCLHDLLTCFKKVCVGRTDKDLVTLVHNSIC